MAGSLLPRVKTWSSTEDVTASDLNAEFNNVLTADQPLYVDDYSTDVTQMQVTTDPGEVGTESKATTLAGELARLRFMISEITGKDEWYETPDTSLLGVANALGGGISPNRIVSGRVRTDSAQPIYLVPNGAARTVKLDGTPTNFVYYVDGTQYTITTDVTLTNLTLAPSSNNTCLVNYTMSDLYWSKYAGEDGSELVVDNMGSEISALVGKFAAFGINNGSTNEYFIAYVKSTTVLSKIQRGYFFDSADAPIPRIAIANNDVITLMKLTYIFAKTDLTLTVAYTNPTYGKDEPSSPAVGDYWYDTDNQTWKIYGGVSWSAANATLVGVCIQDTANTIAARSKEFFLGYAETNTLELTYHSATQVKTKAPGQINAWGTGVKVDHALLTWDMTLDLESGVTEASSTYYYFYVTEEGDKVISDKKPFSRPDLLGFYHPHHSWRCVGRAFNNSSSNLEQVDSYYKADPEDLIIKPHTVAQLYFDRERIILLSGSGHTELLPPAAGCRGNTFTFIHNGTSITHVYVLDGNDSETIGGSSTVSLHTNGQKLTIVSDGANWLILRSDTNTNWTSASTITLTATTSDPTKADGIGRDVVYWRRVGSMAHIRYSYYQTNTTNAVLGSGDYLFGCANIGTMDTTSTSVYTGDNGGDTNFVQIQASAVGAGVVGGTATNASAILVPYNSTTFRCWYQSTANYGWVGTTGTGAAGFGTTTANLSWNFEAIVQISGWLP